ncbi:MAG: hypothetical protein LBN05_06930 [Oscillospiraceae bacterium]|jgi:hypothetical protein|nr:hypothetical protein [Oscillospiraceae bacterium]
MKRLLHSNIFAYIAAVVVGVGYVCISSFGRDALWAKIVAVLLAAIDLLILFVRIGEAGRVARQNKHYRSSRVYFSVSGQMLDSRNRNGLPRTIAIVCLSLALCAMLIGTSVVYSVPPRLYQWMDARAEKKAEPTTEDLPAPSVSESETQEQTTEPSTVPEETEEDTTEETTTAPIDVTPRPVTTTRPTQPRPTAPKPTVPTTTKPKPTVPPTTAPKPTVPTTTKPKPTVPATSKPKPTVPPTTAPKPTTPTAPPAE